MKATLFSLSRSKLMIRTPRLPNISGEGDNHAVSSADLSPHSRYSVSEGPLYLPRHDRRLGKRSTAPTNSINELFP